MNFGINMHVRNSVLHTVELKKPCLEWKQRGNWAWLLWRVVLWIDWNWNAVACEIWGIYILCTCNSTLYVYSCGMKSKLEGLRLAMPSEGKFCRV